jgi:hypothetical protein
MPILACSTLAADNESRRGEIGYGAKGGTLSTKSSERQVSLGKEISLATVRELLTGKEPRAALTMLKALRGGDTEAEALALEGAAQLSLGNPADVIVLASRENARGLLSLEFDIVHAQALGLLGREAEAIDLIEMSVDRIMDPPPSTEILLQARLIQSQLCLAVHDPARALWVLARVDARLQSGLQYQSALFAAAINDEVVARRSALQLGSHPQASGSEIVELCTTLFERGLFSVIIALADERRANAQPVLELAGYVTAARLMLMSPSERIDERQVLAALAEIDVWVNRRTVLGPALFRLAWFGRQTSSVSVIGNLIARALDKTIDLGFFLGPLVRQLQSEVEELLGLLPNRDFWYFWEHDHGSAADLMARWGRLCCANGAVYGVFALAIAHLRAPHRAGVRFAFAQALVTTGQLEHAQQIFASTGCIADPEVATVIWPPAWPQQTLDPRPYEALLPPHAAWPTISIIIPTYNQGCFIEETLQSILSQRYPALELIVIDGGSTDQTLEVIDCYRSRIDYLVSEPDKGQSDAINKGFKLANGDLVTWLNSDDMLAPGAMHMWALAWIKTDADLLFGICMAHRDHAICLINQPRLTQGEFNLATMANIGDYWLQGHFFYQPEVVFTKRILVAAGNKVNTDNHYCMDYELFLNFALHNATVAKVSWPTALFRQHDGQKTSRIDECVREQGRVRDNFTADLLLPERKDDIAFRLRRFNALVTPRILVVSTRLNKIIAPGAVEEVQGVFSKAFVNCTIADEFNPASWLDYDVVILMVHLRPEERTALEAVSKHFNRPLLIGWFWDNHHLYMDNIATCRLLDIVIPGHGFAAAYLRSVSAALWPSLPLCVTQWTAEMADGFVGLMTPVIERKRDLYGGFVQYPDARERNARLVDLHESGLFPMIYTIDPISLDRYFGQTSAQRFAEWGEYATSLCLPFDQDLSQRFFDAWLTGQVPVVTADIVDLRELPELSVHQNVDFVIADDASPSAIQAAAERALKLFDNGGDEGALRRHSLVLGNHMMVHRLQKIVSLLRTVAPGDWLPASEARR